MFKGNNECFNFIPGSNFTKNNNKKPRKNQEKKKKTKKKKNIHSNRPSPGPKVIIFSC